MNRHALLQTIHKDHTRLRLLSKKVAADFSVEDIHELRVATKRLRALLRLVGPDDRRLPKGARRVYRFSGEIRNLQLLRKRLVAFRDEDHSPLPADFLGHLDARVILLKQETRRLIETGGGVKKLYRRSIAGLPPRISRDRQVDFVHTMIHLSHPATGDVVARLHALRKSLKDLLYTWPYLGNAARRLAVTHFGRHSAMKEHAVLLGEYLDVAFQLRLLEDRALFPGDLDLGLLHEICEHWRHRMGLLLRRLDKVLRVRFEPEEHEINHQPA